MEELCEKMRVLVLRSSCWVKQTNTRPESDKEGVKVREELRSRQVTADGNSLLPPPSLSSRAQEN